MEHDHDQDQVRRRAEVPEPIADRAREAMPMLTAAERKVARRLLSDQATVGLESSAALAARAGVSGPTVTRFVKKLGFAGYGAFQSAIRTEIDARMVSPVDLLRAGGGAPQGGLHRYGAPVAESVRQTMDSLAEHEFEAACRLLADVRRPVLAAGGWTTQVLARHLAIQLQQIRPAVHVAGETASEVSSWVADAGPRLTAVLFDVRRYEQRMIALAETLRSRSAKVVLVTDTWLSPASAVADVVLPARVEAGHGFDSLVPALAVVEAMVDRTAGLLGDSAVERFRTYDEFSTALAPRWETGAQGEGGVSDGA